MDIENLINDLDEMVNLLNNDDSIGIATWLSLANSATEIRNILKQLGDKWIPVSERLPEPDKYQLFTINRHGLNEVVAESFYNLNYEVESRGTISKILAWRPLPEPFKEE